MQVILALLALLLCVPVAYSLLALLMSRLERAQLAERSWQLKQFDRMTRGK